MYKQEHGTVCMLGAHLRGGSPKNAELLSAVTWRRAACRWGYRCCRQVTGREADLPWFEAAVRPK